MRICICQSLLAWFTVQPMCFWWFMCFSGFIQRIRSRAFGVPEFRRSKLLKLYQLAINNMNILRQLICLVIHQWWSDRALLSILSQYYCERIVLVICKRMMSHRWNALKRAASYYGEWIGLSDRCSTVVRTSRTSTRAARLKRTGARIAGRSLCKSLWQSLISIFPCY